MALYFSVGKAQTLNGLSVTREDIIAWDGNAGFSIVFDGSDVGLTGVTIDAFTFVNETEILLSFASPEAVPGVAGTVDDSDIVRFTATSLGTTTSGAFDLYFDASDVGLTKSSEDIDVIELLPDGRLLLSTRGSFSVSGVSGRDEDILAFTPASLGAITTGSWSLYFDGSDVALGRSGEDVDAVAVDALGRIYLSTAGNFSVSGVSGADEDVFVFEPASLGETTSGVFQTALFFDGSAFGLGSNDLFAIDLP